jgi:hypothetical protein
LNGEDRNDANGRLIGYAGANYVMPKGKQPNVIFRHPKEDLIALFRMGP